MPRASRSRKVERETCRLGAAVRKKSSPVAQPRWRYRVLYTIHYTGVCYYIIRGEQYFREEFINVTENVAVNRYCSLCATTYYIL